MVRINIKYKCGQDVSCLGVRGTITALFIRGKGRAYEFSYLDNNNNPTSVAVDECELDNESSSKLGFKRQ